MELDRGTLARIDRKLLASLGQDETFQMVRVPVTEAKWSTWRRYCDAAGVSMGRAIVTLIDRELVSVFGEATGDDAPVFAQQAEEELTIRKASLSDRERDVEEARERLRAWGERLRVWESEFEAEEQRVEFASKLAARNRDATPKVGRNELCPCASGLKYKRCHGA